MISAEQALVWFLRLTAVLLFAAVGAVFMPYAWMNAIHEGLELGDLPDQPLVGYLARSLSALYAGVGAACWHMASDVRRYLPALRFAVPVTLAFDVTLIGVDIAVELPGWWTWIEGAVILSWTGIMWGLVRRLEMD
jgi:hypothetical protein